MKKKLSLLLAAAVVVSALAGCGPKNTGSASSASGSPSGSPSSGGSSSSLSDGPSGAGESALPKFMVLSGPTGVGAAKLLADEEGKSAGRVIASSDVAAENKEVTDALVNGDADIAAIATNVAANLYAKSDGAIQVLAINTLGVLYILEKGDAIQSMADLRGKTVYATGQGANPEYVLNHLLTENGVAPAEVDIQWMTAQEVSAQMASSTDGICMLPVPAATALMMKDSGVRQAISLSEAWDALDQGALAMGCIVARTDYIEANPRETAAFLAAYEASISYMSDAANREEAAKLVAQYGITPSEQIAAAAIPQCNLTYLTGDAMKDTLEQYYQILFQADPSAIGGALPYDSFYYGVD